MKNSICIICLIGTFLLAGGIPKAPLSMKSFYNENSGFEYGRGSYLIILAHSQLSTYLSGRIGGRFIEFKESQGFDVDVIALSEAGVSASLIKSTIANKLAEDPMLEYVLLMGDVDGFAAFPSFYYGPDNDVSDQKYTHILGDDNIPDVFIGRLSIDSLSDLAVIMAKTIQYATDPLLYDSDWLSRGLIVAGNYLVKTCISYWR